MKSLLNFQKRLLAAVVVLLCSGSAFADNYPAISIDEVFVLKNMDFNQVWAFTAEKEGVVKIVGVDEDSYFGSCLNVYQSDDFKQSIENFFYTPTPHYEFQAEAGHTYYIKNNNWNGEDISAKLTMSEPFAFANMAPENGGLFYITSNCTATLSFTTSSVTFTEGEITANGNVIKVYNFLDYNELVKSGIFTYTEEGTSGVVNWNGNICAHIDNGITIDFTTQTGHGFYNVIYNLLNEGKLKASDPIKLTMHGIKSMLTGEMLNGNGEFEATWYCAGAPTVLTSSQVPETILSWFNEGDENGVATFTFSRQIKSAMAIMEMGAGEGYEDIYTEYIADDHVIISGNTVKIDFSGVMRTNATMNLKYKWNEFTIKLTNVVDVDGNGTYSEDQGSASSYTFSAGYKDITSKLSYEISPATGATLTEANKQVEIWFNNPDVIEYDGVSILYYAMDEVDDTDADGNPVKTLQNVAHETLVPLGQLRITTDAEGTTIVCPLPALIYQANNICVRLNVTKTKDGNPHNIVAYYNTTLSYDLDIQRVADPVTGSTVHRLSEIYLTIGSTYTINSNLANSVSIVNTANPQESQRGSIVTDGRTNAKIVLSRPITESGTYEITIPQGAIGDYVYGESKYMSGITNKETKLQYTVSGQWDGRDVIAVPGDGATVGCLNSIRLTFFNYNTVAPSWDVEKAAYVEEILSDGQTIVHNGSFTEKADTNNELEFVLGEQITTAGKYRFVLTAGSVVNAATGDPITKEYVFNYVVTGEIPEGIESIETSLDKTIYTINGLKVDAITQPGLYIVNGKKVIVGK